MALNQQARVSSFSTSTQWVSVCSSLWMEDTRADGSEPFLDMMVMLQPDGIISTAMYKKPTHTDLYLQWDSHHTISTKYNVVSILTAPTARRGTSTKSLAKIQISHLGLEQEKDKNTFQPNPENNNNSGINQHNSTTTTSKKTYTVVPYTKGLREF